jgi:hypothetical protein
METTEINFPGNWRTILWGRAPRFQNLKAAAEIGGTIAGFNKLSFHSPPLGGLVHCFFWKRKT